MNLLYSAATLVALIVFAPYFLYQALRHHKYVASLGQRLGYLPVSFNPAELPLENLLPSLCILSMLAQVYLDFQTFTPKS